MKSTRDRILQTLLNSPRATINDLSLAVGINAISVRHHLTSLQAEGLIVTEEERHGVGRPRRVYFLSEAGMERFPSRYMRLADHLLGQLKATLPEESLNSLLEKVASSLISKYDINLKAMSLERRVEVLQDIMMQEGFLLEVEKTPDSFVLKEVSCPYYHIGQSHPEICAVDQALITRILSVPVEKRSCILSGDQQCSYVIPNHHSMEG